MDFKEYLVKQGVTEEQATTIVKGMPAEKFYLTQEEKLDERYTKLKEQKEQADADLVTANKLVDDLKKSNKSNEDLQSSIADYKQQVDDLNTQRAEDRKQAAIELALTKAGALNTKAAKALLDSTKLEVTEDGINGLDEQLEAVKKENGFLFQKDEPDKPTITTAGNPNASNAENDPFAAKLAKYQ